MKRVFILGATGSIGISTLEIAEEYSDKIEVVGLSAHSNDEGLSSWGKKLNCKTLCLTGRASSTFQDIKHFGMEALLEVIKQSNADVVVNGIAGASGLRPSIITLEAGISLALANKESMVMAGPLMKNISEKTGAKLLPVDSEHSAVFHLLENSPMEEIDEIILTASGGAFRDKKVEELENVTVEDALKHPTWDMGTKITIDSASMANKGLEVIEAYMLFGIDIDKIKVLIHPQSYVHSMIRKSDYSIYAQISAPNMKLPIQNAIFYPHLLPVKSCYLDLTDQTLTFKTPDRDKFEMLYLAYDALRKGQQYTIAYNAANEVLVDSFINKDISFLDIPRYMKKVLDLDFNKPVETVEQIILLDKQVREETEKLLGR